MQNISKFGFHINSDSLINAFEEIHKSPFTAFQLYVGNSIKSTPPTFDLVDILKTRAFIKETNKPIYSCIHGCLAYNMAGSVDGVNDKNYNYKLKSCRYCLLTELDIGVSIYSGVVAHIGYQKDIFTGINTIADTITYGLETKSNISNMMSESIGISQSEYIKSRKIILENAAGEKNRIGSNFTEIDQIIKIVKPELRNQIKVVIDTAHIFGAGLYDFGSIQSMDSFFQDFKNTLGIEKLELFHLNDSKVEYDSKKDRHESLLNGYIFKKNPSALIEFVNRCQMLGIPFICETPENPYIEYNKFKH